MNRSRNFKLFQVIAVTVLLTVLLAVGCIDEITFDAERTENQLVVNGKIYDRPGPYTLELGLTSTESTVPAPLNGALVTLIDGDGNREMYTNMGKGIYELPGNIITGETGQTYHIEIELPDGRIFESISEAIPYSPRKDSIYFEIGTSQGQSTSGRPRDVPTIFVYSDTQLPNSSHPVFIRWRVESVYSFKETEPIHPLAPPANTCYVSENPDPQRISIFSTRESNSGFIQNQLLVQTPVVSHKYYRRHYFNVISTSVSERRFNYWERIDEVINQTGTIFDVPPATVKGNIINSDNEEDQALGYFEASAIDTARTFITRSDFSLFIPDPCSGFDRHPACEYCLRLENSTLERPYYF